MSGVVFIKHKLFYCKMCLFFCCYVCIIIYLQSHVTVEVQTENYNRHLTDTSEKIARRFED